MDINEAYKSNATKNAARFMNLSVLIYHVLCLILFFYLNNIIMIIAGIIYILVYSLMFLLINHNHYMFTIIFLTIDMSVFNTICVLILGWSYGFQLYIFIGIIAAFYVKYLTIRKTFVFSYSMSFICVFEFLFLKLFTPQYVDNSPLISQIAYVSNTIFAFFTIIFLMLDFSRNIIFYEKQLLILSQKDSLTGLNNRYSMNNILKTFYEDAQNKNTRICLGMVDIDDFKKINDSYGHECGDFVLKTIGAMLIDMESKTLKTARWGGEEFIVAHKYTEDFQSCYKKAEEFRKRVEEFDFACFGKHFNVTVTIGIADYKNEMSIHELIKMADDNLYRGKREGKNRVVS